MIRSKLKPIKLFSFVLKTVFFTLICLFFLNCEEQPLLEFDEKTFYREWAAWKALGITDYSVERKTEWLWPTTYSIYNRVFVKDNKIYKIEPLDGKNHSIDYSNAGDAILGTYAGIKSIYNKNKNEHGSIKIAYNSDFHYPEIIHYDLPRKYNPKEFGLGTSYLSEFTLLTSEIEE